MKKAYLQLSQDIGQVKPLETIDYSQPSGSQASHAGKIKSKSPGNRSRSRNDFILGKEFLGTFSTVVLYVHAVLS